MTVTSRAPLGSLPDSIAFSPKSDYIYVGNYFGSDLQVFHIQAGKLKQIGANIKLGGQPASMRGLPH
jgi:DNA-binding beta-propeller fold protein YncE